MSTNQKHFEGLADELGNMLRPGEVYLANLAGEVSDFCRLNHGKVRQAGAVSQDSLSLKLIRGLRNVEGSVTLARDPATDRARVADLLATLREQIEVVPDDPHLLYATTVRSTTRVQPSELPPAGDVIRKVTEAAAGLDLVGIYASGTIHRGFANSFGQRNWFETASFNLDWSLYERADKAVKAGYAGFRWSDAEFAQRLGLAREQLAVLKKEPRTIKPGKYRAYLSPSALHEVTSMLCWGGFGLKSHRTKLTPLIRMLESGARLATGVTLRENTAGGIAPDFSASGFTRPPSVTLIEQGAYRDALVSARSAKEYGAEPNGASEHEAPSSLDMSPGDIPLADVCARLGEGIYINNLWYLNYSDRPACRMTGMTRFATFWVEGGRIVAPLNVMRFDETLYHLLGDRLMGLTREREMIFENSTYGGRATGSVHLPGALVEGMTFTL